MSKVTDINSYKRKRKRAGNTRWVLFVVFLFACAIGGYFFALSPFFNITDIQVLGNETVDKERVLSLSGLEKGANIFASDLSNTSLRILIDPGIGACEIERNLPGTIKIKISERQAAAIVPTGSAFLYVDDTGVVLARYREVAAMPLPLLVGIGDFPPGAVPGAKIDNPKIKAALSILSLIPAGEAQVVEEINVSDEQKIVIYVAGGIKVSVGDAANFAEKFQLTKKILAEVTNNGKREAVQYIDVSIPEKPVIYYN